MEYYETEQGELHLEALGAEAEMARESWDILDIDGSGHLCIREVGTLFEKMGEAMSDAELSAAFEAMDLDGDGEIDYPEFASWWEKQHEDDVEGLSSYSSKVKAIWNQIDADGSGHLCEDEVRNLFNKIGRKLSSKKFKKAFAEMDRDGDREIDYSEFVEWWTKQTHDDFVNLRHFEDYADDIKESTVALERKEAQLQHLIKLQLAELGVPSVAAAGATASAAAGAAAAAVASAVPDLGIEFPGASCHMEAIMGVVEKFKKKLESAGGVVAEKVAEIGLTADMSLTQLVRAMSQVLQVQVIALARDKIVPEIDAAVETCGLPGVLIVKKVKAIVYELAEKTIRKFSHQTIKMAVAKANASINPPGCKNDATLDDGEEEEDPCGYLVSAGGYKAANFALAPGPGDNNKLSEYLNKVIDPTVSCHNQQCII
eukprot:COSAG01_NODE_2276_length_8012_cov_3.670037_4_plen_429_part_01